MAAAQRAREEAFLKKENLFRNNAFLVIQEVLELNNSKGASEDTTVLVDEVLHSIFFLGKINNPLFFPESIVSDDEMLTALKVCFPRPFELCSSQLPRRSPISCVLDLIVHLFGQNNEEKIIERLQTFILQLKQGQTNYLVSSTICVSQNTGIQNSVRYYGVSMSNSGPNPGRIMVAASCLNTWDSYVAGAVMTYYPERNSDFDGTIKLPQSVRCQAFNISERQPMPPCRSCGNLFGLTTTETREWAYGNCAEVESVSKLLTNEQEVRQQARPRSETYTDERRQQARERVRKYLNELLRTMRFKGWDETFYTPQRVSS